jgi:cytochrome P450
VAEGTGDLTAVTDIALTSPEVVADPYPHFAEARRRAPVQWHDGLGMWLAFTHGAANAVLRARSLGRVWQPRWPDEPMPAFALIHVNSLLENEPPAHTRLRRLVAGAFARGHVERLRPRVTALAGALADQVADAGADGSPVDLIATYAEPLPVQVIATLLGVPEPDWPLLRPWSNAIVKMYEYDVSAEQKAAAEQASADFVDYLRDLVAVRREQPSDDLVSSLIAETDSDGGRLSEDELITTCTLLLNAGHEASVNVVGNGVLALFGNPDQWQRLLAAEEAGDSLVDTAVEELIRFDSPLQLFERTALADTRIGEVTVRAGEKVAALLGSANRDPAVFADPDRFDVRRPNAREHLAFSAGVHYCIGAALARAEGRIGLQVLFERYPELALAGPATRRRTRTLRGYETLPVHPGPRSSTVSAEV